MVDADAAGSRSDGHHLFRLIEPMFTRAAFAIEESIGVQVIEGSEAVAAPHHRHATILRGCIIEIDEHG